VRQGGTGRHHDPFRYWLTVREPLIRPDGGSPEELAAWNDRSMAEMFERLEMRGRQDAQDRDATPSRRAGGQLQQ
jgi:hypothetical protein